MVGWKFCLAFLVLARTEVQAPSRSYLMIHNINLRHARRITAFTLLLHLFFFSLAGAQPQQQRRARERPQTPSHAAQPSSQPPDVKPEKRPRLVLLIVVDQFRYDYLERFGDLFVAGGIKRLMREGASWTNANYDHMPTYTASGHATMMTGAWPAENGIIANEWPDRESGKRVTSVSDSGVKLLGGEEGEMTSSPRRLMASTVGDELRLATGGRSKVIGISEKDRAAILPAGRHASAAYWFSEVTGRMVTSDFYFNRLPAWVESFNGARPADKFFRQSWERLLPSETEYLKRAGPDAPSWEIIRGEGEGIDTNTFPHVITGGASSPNRDYYRIGLGYSPFSNDILLSFTEQAIINENLGADDDTDVLALSFSANDHVGHRFGPYSQELMDVTLRVDRQIAALLDFVNTRVGLQNTIVVFTADHGVMPIPEHAGALGLPGGRIETPDVLRAMRLAISARYNPKNESPDPTADYIFKDKDFRGVLKDSFFNGNLYFNPVALKRDGISQEEIERVAGEAAMTVPGIRGYFTRTQLQRGAVSPADPIARRVLHGFYARRSGDVIILYEPFKKIFDYKMAADHGSPYSYDTHVPLMIMGTSLKPGRYIEAATPADIAPTLATMLDVQTPSNSVGRVLTEAFAATR